MKLLDFEGGVNVALGLAIIQTSVDHGTAFNTAGKGVAGHGSFVQALQFAGIHGKPVGELGPNGEDQSCSGSHFLGTATVMLRYRITP